MARAAGVDLPDDLALWSLAGGRPDVDPVPGEPEELGRLLEGSFGAGRAAPAGRPLHAQRRWPTELVERALAGHESPDGRRPRVRRRRAPAGRRPPPGGRTARSRASIVDAAVGRRHRSTGRRDHRGRPRAVGRRTAHRRSTSRWPTRCSTTWRWPQLDVVVGNPPFLSQLGADDGPRRRRRRPAARAVRRRRAGLHGHRRAVPAPRRASSRRRAAPWRWCSRSRCWPPATRPGCATRSARAGRRGRDLVPEPRRLRRRRRRVRPGHRRSAAAGPRRRVERAPGARPRRARRRAAGAAARSGDEATTTAGFRSEYYGMVDHVARAATTARRAGRSSRPGSIDLGRVRVGRARRRGSAAAPGTRPVVDVARARGAGGRLGRGAPAGRSWWSPPRRGSSRSSSTTTGAGSRRAAGRGAGARRAAVAPGRRARRARGDARGCCQRVGGDRADAARAEGHGRAAARRCRCPSTTRPGTRGTDAFRAGDLDGFVDAMAAAYGVGPEVGGVVGRAGENGLESGGGALGRVSPTSGVARSAGSSNLGRTPKVLSHPSGWGCGPGDRATKCSGLDPTEGVRSRSRRTGGRSADGRQGGRVRAARRPPARPPVAAAGHRRLARRATRSATASCSRLGDRAFALEGGGVLRDVTIAYETWGTLDERRVERRARVPRPHRRQPRRRAARARAPDRRLVGRPHRPGPADRHRPLVRRVRQRARRLPGHHRPGQPAPRRRRAVGEPLPGRVGPRHGAQPGGARRPPRHPALAQRGRRLDGRHAGARVGA